MANNAIYTLSFVTINGRLLTEHGEMTLTRNGNHRDVHTMAKGWAGITPGAPDCDIEVTNAVPAADFEMDPGDMIFGSLPVEIGITGPAGKTAVSKGFILSDSFRQGVDTAAQLSFRFKGSFPKFE